MNASPELVDGRFVLQSEVSSDGVTTVYRAVTVKAPQEARVVRKLCVEASANRGAILKRRRLAPNCFSRVEYVARGSDIFLIEEDWLSYPQIRVSSTEELFNTLAESIRQLRLASEAQLTHGAITQSRARTRPNGDLIFVEDEFVQISLAASVATQNQDADIARAIRIVCEIGYAFLTPGSSALQRVTAIIRAEGGDLAWLPEHLHDSGAAVWQPQQANGSSSPELELPSPVVVLPSNKFSEVQQPPHEPLVIKVFESSEVTVAEGGMFTLSWETTGASHVTLDPAAGDSFETSDQITLVANKTTLYKLTAIGPNGSTVSDSRWINVTPPPPPILVPETVELPVSPVSSLGGPNALGDSHVHLKQKPRQQSCLTQFALGLLMLVLLTVVAYFWSHTRALPVIEEFRATYDCIGDDKDVRANLSWRVRNAERLELLTTVDDQTSATPLQLGDTSVETKPLKSTSYRLRAYSRGNDPLDSSAVKVTVVTQRQFFDGACLGVK